MATPTLYKLLIVELWLSLLYGVYNGASIALLTEIMPARVRTAAFSLAFSLAAATFGGFTPAICTYLIARTGNKAAPALWLTLAAVIGLVGAILSRHMKRTMHSPARDSTGLESELGNRVQGRTPVGSPTWARSGREA